MEIENGILCMLNAEVRKKANINVKKLNSLKHRVRSQITRLKLQKSFLRLRAWSIIMNIVLIIATIKYA